VQPPLEAPAEEAARLRRCLNDLVSVMALPALWAGGEPRQIVGTLMDALREMLRLAFVFVRLNDSEDGTFIELMRASAPLEGIATARDLGKLLGRSLGTVPSHWPPSARVSMGDTDVQVAAARLGLQGELGVVVTGCRRLDFPGQAERLLLDVAANQAAIGLQQARLLGEQKRLAEALDERVARRTSELAAANAALKTEVAERRRVEEALRESERESRLIVDSIPGMVAVLSAGGAIEFVNRRILDYYGIAPEELGRWQAGNTNHPEDHPHVVEAFTRAIASGEPFDIETRARRFDGVYRWVQSRGAPLRDASGRVVRWYNLITDIDDRKRAEEALAASEGRLKLTVDTIPALAWSARADGTADFFSQHYLDFIGLPAEQASGWGWTTALHPDDVNGLATTWQRIMASEAPGEAEARLRRRDGEYRWFLFRASPLRDESGRIVRWYGVNTDIEDRKRAEAELRRAYDSFADAQRLSRTGSFITDIVADDHNWSLEAYRIFEFEPGTKVTVQRIRDIVHPDDLPSFDSVIARGMSGVNVNFSFRIVTAHGAVKHIRGVAHVIEEIEGRPMFVGALQDVTETIVAEEALNRARSELAHVARVTALSTLTASIAHEVNQPLSGIITNASTCLRMLDADPPNVDGARETARRTIRDGHRASDVITRLRALFSRKEFTLESMDLSEATREVLALSSSDLQGHRVIVRPQLTDDLPLVIGDRVQLQQVILNLLRNAAEAMGEVHDRARELTVRTEREGSDRVRVTVRDTGSGVDPGSMDTLFDAFYTTKSGGMGIGLSVSRSIVERHHGRLWVEPNEGPGATFAFSIPCRPESTGDAEPVMRSSLGMSGSSTAMAGD
jgi:PAS domain S-box-containing protein